MEPNILIGLIATVAFSIAITYFITNRKANKKISNYQSIDQAIQEASKNIASLEQKLESTNREVEKSGSELKKMNKETKDLQELKENADRIFSELTENQKKLENNKIQILKTEEDIKSKDEQLHELLSKIDIYDRLDNFIDNGHYEIPQYLFETSERFAEEIKRIREFQKELIKDKNAITFPESTAISENKAYNKKILDGQVKLMLTAFNIECDSLIGKVKPSTFPRTLERIENLANNLEKSAATLRCGFNIKYIESKYEECRVQYQYALKKQEEQEEQRLIREQIKEEQRVIKEYERAVAQAEKEEKMYRDMLAKAKEELSRATDEERIIAEQRIYDLEQQLAEAQAKEERAKSMAEQTRKGHVYVIVSDQPTTPTPEALLGVS
ncbi:DUF4041 domain-containing protein [Endozoicomonas sp. SESOKO1]|uniref:DUF4041 domain-containing protein n=1 Tax=Endozoicomonas sp. SESOKO1 TaxID=2828742 RepID=UPI0021480791|nr:DUF4041 domain-containing protein [Endozoicomonas sp. SESOKO1]